MDLGQRYNVSFTPSKVTSQLTLLNSIFKNSTHSWRHLLVDYQHIWCQIPSEGASHFKEGVIPLTSRENNVGVTSQNPQIGFPECP